MYLCDSLSLHTESLDSPVTRRNGILKTHRDEVAAHMFHNIKLCCFDAGNVSIGYLLQFPI